MLAHNSQVCSITTWQSHDLHGASLGYFLGCTKLCLPSIWRPGDQAGTECWEWEQRKTSRLTIELRVVTYGGKSRSSSTLCASQAPSRRLYCSTNDQTATLSRGLLSERAHCISASGRHRHFHLRAKLTSEGISLLFSARR